ncbi:serine hydrolase domain-containing protein [Kribbella sp. NPDC049174]|uniref:serine hydrolase domain-containing protein n=1 Tax=Kribbella sp. NPDC049174 TaxID=3364112 RepID=UPI003719A4F9
MRELLESLVADGRELGVQVAAYLDGDLVVDAWSRADVDGQTLFPVFSVSKGIGATAVHILVDRGILGYDDRVADLWPSFGAHGKDEVTVGHVLEHSAGVPFFPEGPTGSRGRPVHRTAGRAGASVGGGRRQRGRHPRLS